MTATCNFCGRDEDPVANFPATIIAELQICASCLARQYAMQYLRAMAIYFPDNKEAAELIAIWCSLLLLEKTGEKS
jgi:hypothetical protein